MLNIGEVERPATKGVKAGDTGETGELMAKNPFYSLLGDCYTIVVSDEPLCERQTRQTYKSGETATYRTGYSHNKCDEFKWRQTKEGWVLLWDRVPRERDGHRLACPAQNVIRVFLPHCRNYVRRILLIVSFELVLFYAFTLGRPGDLVVSSLTYLL